LLAALIGAIVLSQRSGKLSEPSDTVSSSDDPAQKGDV
jgi:NADH-quinone oxidoreductase subunit J